MQPVDIAVVAREHTREAEDAASIRVQGKFFFAGRNGRDAS